MLDGGQWPTDRSIMSDNSPRASEAEARFNEVLASVLEAEERGCPLDRVALLEQYPELASELNAFFENRSRVAAIDDPLRTQAYEGAGTGPAPAASEPEARFGEYVLLCEIARGGMGVVYRAHQLSLNRQVALKTILAGELASSTLVRRFHIEAEAAALLDHPHIVPIYEVGEIEGQHYFTMKLVEGGSLASRIGEFSLPAGCASALAERRQTVIAALMATVARAVHHAHERGILHRDLKPGNILLQSPAPTDGGAAPLVADFGLAKRFDRAGDLTQSQTIVGTAAYMAPEQALATRGALTTATDVYGLGSILYELLTGRPPFLAKSFVDTVAQVVDEPPVAPSKRNPSVASDLEAVCLKCLEKDPARRYRSAQELADDLERFAAGEAVSLRRRSRLERARRWVRHNRLTAALVGAVAALLVVTTAGSLVAAWRIGRARDLAARYAREAATLAAQDREARTLAARARDYALAALEAERQANLAKDRLLVSGYVANGTRALDAGDTSGALVWYGEALRREAGDPAREEAHRTRLSAVLRHCSRPVQMWCTPVASPPPVLSPDGMRVLLVDLETAVVADVLTGENITPPMKHGFGILHATFSRDGRRVVTASSDFTARVWDADSGAPIGPALRHDKGVRFAAFSPDGRQLVTGSHDKAARVWTLSRPDRNGDPVGPAAPLVLRHQQTVRYAAFSQDSRHLLTISGELTPGDHELLVWDLSNAAQPDPIRFPQKAALFVRWAVFSPDAAAVIWQRFNLAVQLWDYRGDPQRLPARQIAPAVPNVRAGPDEGLSADGTRVIAASGSVAHIHELRTGHAIGPPLVHGDEVQLAALSPDGRLAATAGRDRVARVWITATGQPLIPPLRHGQRVTHVRFNDDGSRLLTLAADGTARVWDLGWHEPNARLVPTGGKGQIALSPDGALTASLNADGAVLVHDARNGKTLNGPWSLGQPARRLAFAPDARRLLAVSDTNARVWDAVAGHPLGPVWTDAGFGVAEQYLFTPDSSHVAILGPTGRLRVWNIATGQGQANQLLPGTPTPRGLALAPDGRRVGVVSEEQRFEVRDVITGALLLGPLKHVAPLTHAAFSADGSRLAVAAVDGTAVVWDAAGRQIMATAPGHGHPLRQVTFSGDGRRLAAVAEEHTARVWDVATGQPITPLLSQADPIATALLSPDGRCLITRGEGGMAQVWDLVGDGRPVDDLVRFTRVLSGLALDPMTGGIEPIETGDLRADWTRLRTRYPAEFLPPTP
jgi:serine/threonine protein kinase/WD40 repeat protein